MTTRLMKMSGIADMSSVEKTRKPARPAPKAAAPRKRAPAKPVVATETAPTTAEPIQVEATRIRPVRNRRRRFVVASSGLVLLLAASATAAFLLRGDKPTPAAASSGISAAQLVTFASSHDGPVYWVGPMTSRKLELTTTSAGTFVRYLPLSSRIGNSERAITVATYPLRNAFATASARSTNPQMTSRKTAGRGVAVWSKNRPTSVYLAFPGVPQLVEVYAPNAEQARTLALSGRLRPVR